jgi:hypothetical protein
MGLAFLNSPYYLVHGDKIIATPLYKADHCVEEFRRHLKARIWRKSPLQAAARAHMVQHEDCTETGGYGPERLRCPRIIQHIEAGL